MDIPKHDVPVGLLFAKDLIERLPAERERILQHEIKSREREALQCKGIRRVMHLNAWSSFQMVLAVGLSVFILVFTLGQFAGLARWVQEVRNFGMDIPGLGRNYRISPASVIPTSTVVTAVAKFPEVGVTEAGVIALLVVTALVFWKGYNAYFLAHQAAALRRAQKEMQEEIAVLETWLGDVKVDRKEKKR